MSGDDLPAEVRSANIRLGLALGALALLVVGAFMLLFSRNGLPKSPEIWREKEQERSAREAAPSAEAPAAAPAAAGEESR